MPIPKVERGQTIVEVLVAVTLTAVAFVGLLSLGNLSIKSTSHSRNQNLASSYSSQAADWFRNTRTLFGWEAVASKMQADAGIASTVTYCLQTLPTTENDFRSMTPGECSSNQTIGTTIYTRSIVVDLSQLATKNLKGIINTTWVDNTTPGAQVEVTLGKTQ